MAICLVFLRVSMLSEMQAHLMGGINLKLLYVVGIPALVGMVLAGGIQRSMKSRVAYFYVAIAVWIALATPFSIWKGGSFHLLLVYCRVDLILLFMVAGLALTWKECRLLMLTLASNWTWDDAAGGLLAPLLLAPAPPI